MMITTSIEGGPKKMCVICLLNTSDEGMRKNNSKVLKAKKDPLKIHHLSSYCLTTNVNNKI